jgi:hypothetical protein
MAIACCCNLYLSVWQLHLSWMGNLDPLSYLGFALLHTTSDDEKDQVDFVKIMFHLNDLILNEFA